MEDIKIVVANNDTPEELEVRLNNFTKQGYKIQNSNFEWYCGKVLGVFCLVKDIKD